MSAQYIIVGLIILFAVAYIVRHIYKSTTGHACETGDCKCETKIVKKV